MVENKDPKKVKYGEDYYKNIAKKSWKNPNRNRKVGFATMDEEKHKEVSAKGGRNKKDTEEKEVTEDVSVGEEGVDSLLKVDQGS